MAKSQNIEKIYLSSRINNGGFTKGKSTTGALLTAVHNWHKLLEDGQSVCAVFFDFKKAFDKVPHSILMSKLTNLNLDPHLVSWVASYLRNRSQYVTINGKSSNISEVVSGVPQGSVLGPLLFLIYINDIDLHQNEGSLLLYADDLLLYHPIQSPEDYLKLQGDIDQVELQAWSETNVLLFNQSKCKYMAISRKFSPPLPNMCLNISGRPLYLKLTTTSTLACGSLMTSHGQNAQKECAEIPASRLV